MTLEPQPLKTLRPRHSGRGPVTDQKPAEPQPAAELALAEMGVKAERMTAFR
jgi:hypothetical protein